MPVEVQRQEPLVSINRSRENDYDSVTTNSPRSQCCCSEVTMKSHWSADANEADDYQC